MSILDYFPFADMKTSSMRKEQKQLLEGIEQSDRRFILIEAPTGVGKSAVAVTASRWYTDTFEVKDPEECKRGSHILTVQKYLQSQYTNDFGKTGDNKINAIMSASNYKCDRLGVTCKEGQIIRKNCSRKKQTCLKEDCLYSKEKQIFLEGLYGVTNFDYFLHETYFSGKICKKQMLIMDEAHDIEDKLLGFSSVAFSDRSIYAVCGIHMPKNLKNIDHLHEWVTDDYIPAVIRVIREQDELLERLKNQGSDDEIQAAAIILDGLRERICQLKRFQKGYSRDNWVLCIDKKDSEAHAVYTVKPLFVQSDAQNFLFPYGVDKVILMSATLLDPELICENLGIDLEDAEYLSVNCPFPKANRKIYYYPVGKMSYKFIDDTLPKMVETIKELMKEHENEKGIIHTSSYKVTQAIKEGIKSDRLLTHTTESRHKVLEYHIATKEPTILLSPSFHEGVDLKDGLSRFQIITKIPYPSMADEQIKARLDLDPHWYQWKTCMKLVQSFGRSIRNNEDYAVTYVLDEDFKQFYNRNKDLFPAWLNIYWNF